MHPKPLESMAAIVKYEMGLDPAFCMFYGLRREGEDDGKKEEGRKIAVFGLF